MDYTVYTSVKNRFAAQPNLCDLFKLLSIETWKRIEYAYIKPRIKVYETTITQNLIFAINAYNDQYNMNIDILEALDENANGNDFELIIRYPQEGLEFYAPIQAKKINRHGKYSTMDHGVQIQSLMAYAKRQGASPFYLLYNFNNGPSPHGLPLSNPEELTGCALIEAEFLLNNHFNQKRSTKPDGTLVQKWMIPDFWSLHPHHAFCWHEIVCPDNTEGLIRKIESLRIIEKEKSQKLPLETKNKEDLKPGFFKINTISSKTDNWISAKEENVRKKGQSKFSRPIESLEEFDKEKNGIIKYEGEEISREFSPKSRIILSKGESQNK